MKSRLIKSRIVPICAAIAAMLVAGGLQPPAWAQDSTSRPLRIIMPLSAGSGFDILARAVSQQLEQRTGRKVIVENRPGANMSIAANACKAAAPDGDTICLFTHNLFLNPLVREKLTYDPFKDFEPIAPLVAVKQVVVTGKQLPVMTFNDLVAYSKAHPNTLNYGSVGNGSAAHLVMEWLSTASGADWKHVPFNGAPQVQRAIASGDVHVTFTLSGNVVGRVASGDLKALLIVGDKRDPLLPNVPTFVEAGLPTLKASSWAGMFAPAGTPSKVIDSMAKEFTAIIEDPGFQKQFLEKRGLEPLTMKPAAFKAFIRDDQAAWKPLVEASGVASK
jgi:tripartite-type tricarboxylate transporter receptor subunit TctC